MVNNTAATFSACGVSIILILTLKNENSQDASFVVIGVIMTTFGFCDNVQLDIKFVVWQNIFFICEYYQEVFLQTGDIA